VGLRGRLTVVGMRGVEDAGRGTKEMVIREGNSLRNVRNVGAVASDSPASGSRVSSPIVEDRYIAVAENDGPYSTTSAAWVCLIRLRHLRDESEAEDCAGGRIDGKFTVIRRKKRSTPVSDGYSTT